MADDDAKALLEKMVAELYAQAASGQRAPAAALESWLVAADGQYLGKITDNAYDTKSITNEYGPFGSAYSNTSIFNGYSPYGSEYGQYSVNNPYCTQPPKLYLNGRLSGVVSANEYVPNRIPTKAFLLALKNNIRSLLGGQIPRSETEMLA